MPRSGTHTISQTVCHAQQDLRDHASLGISKASLLCMHGICTTNRMMTFQSEPVPTPSPSLFPLSLQFDTWAEYVHVCCVFLFSLLSTLLVPRVYPQIVVPGWSLLLLCTSTLYYLACTAGLAHNSPQPAALQCPSRASTPHHTKEQSLKASKRHAPARFPSSGTSSNTAFRSTPDDRPSSNDKTPIGNSASDRCTVMASEKAGPITATDLTAAAALSVATPFCSGSVGADSVIHPVTTAPIGPADPVDSSNSSSPAGVEVLTGPNMQTSYEGGTASTCSDSTDGTNNAPAGAVASGPSVLKMSTPVHPASRVGEAGWTPQPFQYVPYVSPVSCRLYDCTS